MNTVVMLVCLILAAVTITTAFRPMTSRLTLAVQKKGLQPLALADEQSKADVDDQAPEVDNEEFIGEDDRKMFDMNRIVRLGRSRDQDGKSNIWSIEPSMEVEEEEQSSAQKNLVIGAVVIGAALASLPLLSAFSSLLPDASNY
jgi:VIT1/CCC1 family predicted Fe2+/Mn2+ transporter